jgi:hypothetical protein
MMTNTFYLFFFAVFKFITLDLLGRDSFLLVLTTALALLVSHRLISAKTLFLVVSTFGTITTLVLIYRHPGSQQLVFSLFGLSLHRFSQASIILPLVILLWLTWRQLFQAFKATPLDRSIATGLAGLLLLTSIWLPLRANVEMSQISESFSHYEVAASLLGMIVISLVLIILFPALVGAVAVSISSQNQKILVWNVWFLFVASVIVMLRYTLHSPALKQILLWLGT